MKSKVKVEIDFVLVSDQFWNILQSTFGGGPVLRFSKVTGYPSTTYVPDVSSIKVMFLILNNPNFVPQQLKKVSFNHEDKMSDLASTIALAC